MHAHARRALCQLSPYFICFLQELFHLVNCLLQSLRFAHAVGQVCSAVHLRDKQRSKQYSHISVIRLGHIARQRQDVTDVSHVIAS